MLNYIKIQWGIYIHLYKASQHKKKTVLSTDAKAQ